MTKGDDDFAPHRQLPGGVAYIWRQVAEDIAGRITGGEWPYGAKLPNREELSAQYGVADRTVRRALRALEEEGMVEVLAHKGAYVTWRPGG